MNYNISLQGLRVVRIGLGTQIYLEWPKTNGNNPWSLWCGSESKVGLTPQSINCNYNIV